MKRSIVEKIFLNMNCILLIVFAFACFYPMYYVLMASFSESGMILAHSGMLLTPLKFNTSAYELVLNSKNIWSGYRNTLFIVIFGSCGSLFVTSAAGFALSKKQFNVGRVIMIFITFTMIFSGGMIPLFIVVRKVGLYDSIWALVLPMLINTTNLIILRTAYANVPDSLEESAKIDGANDLVIYIGIATPLIKSSLAVILLYYSVSYWNSWFPASIYLRTRSKFPLQLILREILIANQTDSQDTELMSESIKYAAIIIATVPILLVYPLLQKYFEKGLMIGAIKQ